MTVDISERTLRSIYFPPFKAAVDAGVGTLMSAFNDLNGVPASGNPFTLTEVLRNQWHFDGLVVSEWTAHATKDGEALEWDGIDVFPIADGKIARKDVYSSSHAPRHV